MHKVVKPFAYSVDGLTSVVLAIGDERDFGDLTGGLLAEGWIKPIGNAAAAEEGEPAVVVTAEPVTSEPPVRRRK